MNRMTPSEQLDNYRITCEVAADARSTREEFRQLDAEIARLRNRVVDLERLSGRLIAYCDSAMHQDAQYSDERGEPIAIANDAR